MSIIKERLDLLREEIQKEDFLDGKGLSNEVNIRIFCYDAAEEMTVTHFLNQLRGDVLLLTGVGDVFPFMRVHTLLEALQPHFSDLPILVMYPGEFDGHYLRLFGRLKPNDYYRAFNFFAEEDARQ